MSDYISREVVLKAFKLTVKNPNKDYQRGMQDTIDCLVPEVVADIPSTDVQPVKHGKWLKRMSTSDSLKCSICGNNHEYITTYCPNCGTRMDGDVK